MQVQELVGIVPWNFVAMMANLFIQVYLLKRFLFKPVSLVQGKKAGQPPSGKNTKKIWELQNGRQAISWKLLRKQPYIKKKK